MSFLGYFCRPRYDVTWLLEADDTAEKLGLEDEEPMVARYYSR